MKSSVVHTMGGGRTRRQMFGLAAGVTGAAELVTPAGAAGHSRRSRMRP